MVFFLKSAFDPLNIGVCGDVMKIVKKCQFGVEALNIPILGTGGGSLKNWQILGGVVHRRYLAGLRKMGCFHQQ